MSDEPTDTYPLSAIQKFSQEAGAQERKIRELEQEAGKWRTKYEQLEIIYNKLADQWNVFQATSRPDNRNIQRAEGAGEMARRLAEVLLGISYSTDVRDILRKLLEDMEGAGGREVEVGGKLARRKLCGNCSRAQNGLDVGAEIGPCYCDNL